MNANNIFIINGNLTKAPILRQTEKGRSFCYLNIAVDNGHSNDSKPDYITVTVWGKQAENASKYLIKGQHVSVAGSISSYIDKERKLHINLSAQDVQFGRKPAITKDKEIPIEHEVQNTSVEGTATEPDPIEPPEEYFSEEPEDNYSPNRYYKFNDGNFTYYINVDTHEKKFQLEDGDIEVDAPEMDPLDTGL